MLFAADAKLRGTFGTVKGNETVIKMDSQQMQSKVCRSLNESN